MAVPPHPLAPYTNTRVPARGFGVAKALLFSNTFSETCGSLRSSPKRRENHQLKIAFPRYLGNVNHSDPIGLHVGSAAYTSATSDVTASFKTIRLPGEHIKEPIPRSGVLVRNSMAIKVLRQNVPIQMKRFSDSDLEDYVLHRMDQRNKAELEERVQKDPALSQRLREVQDVLDPLRQLGQDILNEPLPPKLKAWLEKQRH